jgi:hypothetical protein
MTKSRGRRGMSRSSSTGSLAGPVVRRAVRLRRLQCVQQRVARPLRQPRLRERPPERVATEPLNGRAFVRLEAGRRVEVEAVHLHRERRRWRLRRLSAEDLEHGRLDLGRLGLEVGLAGQRADPPGDALKQRVELLQRRRRRVRERKRLVSYTPSSASK